VFYLCDSFAFLEETGQSTNMQTVNETNELTEQEPAISQQDPKTEFDPCCNAKITSPFYLYKHDSPRASLEVTKSVTRVDVLDVEAGPGNLSPTITQEKRNAQNTAFDRIKFWRRNRQRCMTKPQQRGCIWLARLPPRQRLLVKILIALLIVGAMVGIAVGITAAVHGGVYKNNNTSTALG